MKILFSVAINMRGGITRIEFTARDNYFFFYYTETSEVLQMLGVWQTRYKVVVALLQIPHYTGMAGLLSSCAASTG